MTEPGTDLEEEDEDLPLTFCDQCGHLQLGLRSACEECGVPLDRSVYDPFVAIHQNAAVVRQAVRGRAKPSTFGKAALVGLGVLYLAYSASLLPTVLHPPFTVMAVVYGVLYLVIGILVLAAFHRMMQRDSWAEYRRWS